MTAHVNIKSQPTPVMNAGTVNRPNPPKGLDLTDESGNKLSSVDTGDTLKT